MGNRPKTGQNVRFRVDFSRQCLKTKTLYYQIITEKPCRGKLSFDFSTRFPASHDRHNRTSHQGQRIRYTDRASRGSYMEIEYCTRVPCEVQLDEKSVVRQSLIFHAPKRGIVGFCVEDNRIGDSVGLIILLDGGEDCVFVEHFKGTDREG